MDDLQADTASGTATNAVRRDTPITAVELGW